MTALLHLSDPMTQRLALVLVHFVWQGIAIAVLLAAITALLRVRRPLSRYTCSLLAMLLMAAAPVVTFFCIDARPPVKFRPFYRATEVRTKQGNVSVTARVVVTDPSQKSASLTQSSSGSSIGFSSSAPPTSPSEPATPAPAVIPGSASNALSQTTIRSLWQWSQPWIVITWFGGVALLSVRLLAGWGGVSRLRRDSSPVPTMMLESIQRLAAAFRMATPMIRLSRHVSEAVAVGFVKPMILLPMSWLTELPPDMLEAVIAHELAHIRRCDLWINLLQRILETLLFYHPAVWWVSRRVRFERELCCDELVVGVTQNRLRYAETLEHVGRLSLAQRASPLAVAIAGGRSALTDRIRYVLRLEPQEHSMKMWLAGVLPLLIVGTICWSAINAPTGQASAGDRTAANSPDTIAQPNGLAPQDKLPAGPAGTQESQVSPGEDKATGKVSEENATPSQMLSWTMLIDDALAEKLVGVKQQELPEQGAFRVLRFDAAKLRKTLFDPTAASHVVADLDGPRLMGNSYESGRQEHLHLFPSFNTGNPTTLSSHGEFRGKYISYPGEPFDLQIEKASFDIQEHAFQPAQKWQIVGQKLEYHGDVPAGTLVVFVGNARSTSNKRSFHPVFAFEAFPQLSPPLLRIVTEKVWFKAEFSKLQQLTKQAATFSSQAAPLSSEVSPRWTKALPQGGSVSLVAIGRPKTHPFCWWDPDGQPRSTDWSLQQHAFGQNDVVALVSVRNSLAGDLLRNGVTYSVSGPHQPLSLMRPFGDATDSELFLFSGYSVDEQQRPQIGVNAGDGPWKEIARLKPMEAVTVGTADYILGKSISNPESTAHLILGRRYVSDEEVRLRLIDRQGKVWRVHAGLTESTLSDTRGVPTGWEGWGQYNSDLKLQEIDQYVLEQRPRSWTAFSGFATELQPTSDGQLPTLKTVMFLSPMKEQFPKDLGDKFDVALRAGAGKMYLEVDLQAIVADFRSFIKQNQPADLSQEQMEQILKGADYVFPTLSAEYFQFFSAYRGLKWRLWMAMNRRSLPADQLALREAQRAEMRQFIRTLPITDTHVPRTHGHAIWQLEQLFDNPWFGWFHEPMSPEEVVRMEPERKRWNITGPLNVHSHLNSMMSAVKSPVMANDPRFGKLPVPLDPSVISVDNSALLRFYGRYSGRDDFAGWGELVFDELPRSERRVLTFTRDSEEVPKAVSPGVEAVKKWAAEQQTGLLAYDSASHSLFVLQGAKLAVLTISDWYEADRLTDAELRAVVSEQAKDSLALSEYYGPRPENTGYGAPPSGPLLVVESARGELGVLRVDSVSKHGVSVRMRPRPGTAR